MYGFARHDMVLNALFNEMGAITASRVPTFHPYNDDEKISSSFSTLLFLYLILPQRLSSRYLVCICWVALHHFFLFFYSEKRQLLFLMAPAGCERHKEHALAQRLPPFVHFMLQSSLCKNAISFDKGVGKVGTSVTF